MAARGIALARLAGLLFAAALIASRLSLVLHELVGHGGVAIALGGRISEIGLFWFGGGFVSFDGAADGTAATLAIELGGIACELGLAALALGLARRGGPRWQLACAVLATLDLVHAGFYLASGVHYGYGDGELLHVVLGEARWLLVAPVALATIAAAWFGGQRLAARAGGWLPAAPGWRRIAGLAAAVAVAGGLHAGLSYGEIRLRPDARYGAIMRRQSDRDVDRELAAYLARQRAAGIEPAAVEVDARRAALADAHRPFPLGPIMIALVALAGLAGTVRGARGEVPALAGPGLGAPALAALAALALIGVIRLIPF